MTLGRLDRGRLTKRLRHDQQGAVAMVVAFLLPVFIVVAALAVDGGYMFLLKTELQATADASSLAGTALIPTNTGVLGSSDKTPVIAAAQSYATKNMPSATHGTVLATADVVFGHWDGDGNYGAARTFYPDTGLPGGADTDAIQVITRRASANGNPAGLLFARIFSYWEADVVASATAWAGGSGVDTTCILSLNPTDDGAIEVSGTTILDLGGCGIDAWSNSPIGFKLPGTVTATTNSICIRGDVDESGTVTYITDPPGLDPVQAGCQPPPNPFASLPNPPLGTTRTAPASLSGDNDLGITLDPGFYPNGIEISGNDNVITFSPGIYSIGGAGGIGFKVSGQRNTLNGTGVTFFNTESSALADDFTDIEFSGSDTTTNFFAPTTGTYAGILFMMHQPCPLTSSKCEDAKFKVSGATGSTMDGVILWAEGLVEFSGNSSLTGACGPKIVADIVKFAGANETFTLGGGAGCASSNALISEGVIYLLVL